MMKPYNPSEYMTATEFDRRVRELIKKHADLLVLEVRATRERQKRQAEIYNNKFIHS
jgi:hypothetical protein